VTVAGINIPFLSNVRDFLRGKRQVSDGLGDVADDLADLARDADRAGDRMGDALADGADEATDAVDKLRRKLDDALDAARTGSRRAGDDIGDNVKRGTDKAGEGLGTLKEESAQTARESAASFSGSFDDIADIGQEIAAQAFQGFGPAGQAAGLLAAAGIGFAINALQQSAEKVNENKQRLVELVEAIDEAGGTLEGVDIAGIMGEWGREIADSKSWFEFWQDDAVTRFEQIESRAQRLGLNVRNVFRGMSGADPQAAGDAIAEIDAKLAELEAQQRDLVGTNGELARQNAGAILQLQEQAGAYRDLRGELEQASGLTGEAADLQRRMAEATGDTADATAQLAEAQEAYGDSLVEFVDPLAAYTDQLAAKQAAEQAAAQATADATASTSDSWETYAGAVSVSVDEYLAELRRMVEAQESWANNLETLAERGVSAGVLEELARMGPEGAPLVAQLVTGTDEQLAQLEQLYGRRSASAVATMRRELAGAASAGKDALDAAQRALGPLRIGVEADLSAAERAIRRWRPVIIGEVRAGRAVV
jgi:DNA repair exonuclease SbcCD ATPase subunit